MSQFHPETNNIEENSEIQIPPFNQVEDTPIPKPVDNLPEDWPRYVMPVDHSLESADSKQTLETQEVDAELDRIVENMFLDPKLMEGFFTTQYKDFNENYVNRLRDILIDDQEKARLKKIGKELMKSSILARLIPMAGSIIGLNIYKIATIQGSAMTFGESFVTATAAGALSGATAEIIGNYRNIKYKDDVIDVLEKIENTQSPQECATMIGKIEQALEQEKITGDPEKITELTEKIRTGKLRLNALIESKDLENGTDYDVMKALIESSSKERKALPIIAKKEAALLLQSIQFKKTRVPIDQKEMLVAMTKGLIMGAIAGATSKLLIEIIGPYLHSAITQVTEKAVERVQSIVSDKFSELAVEKVGGTQARIVIEKIYLSILGSGAAE